MLAAALQQAGQAVHTRLASPAGPVCIEPLVFAVSYPFRSRVCHLPPKAASLHIKRVAD
jgi:hypothetical protein